MAQTNIAFWGNNTHHLLSPNSHKSYNKPHHTTIGFDILDISASQKHVAFITTDGVLYSYGVNMDGRLGVGGRPDSKFSINNPTKVKLNARPTKVKCGFSHVCVQLINEELYSWGLGEYGTLGIGQLKSKFLPTRVIIKAKIVDFSCGAMHSGFVDSDGKAYTCGSNQYGELGVQRPDKIATPVLVNFEKRVKQIECGVFYTLLLTTKGEVYGVGNNRYGQLGLGHKQCKSTPTLIKQLQGITFVSAGYHSGAIDKNGYLYIWGSGSFGEFPKPKKISLPTPVDQIFIRGFFGIAISSNSSHSRVYGWGNNSSGQLGSGNFENAKDPLEISELKNIKLDKFACGVNFFIATSKDQRIATLPKDRPQEKYSSNKKDNYSHFSSHSKPSKQEMQVQQVELQKSFKVRASSIRNKESNRESQFNQIQITPTKFQIQSSSKKQKIKRTQEESQRNKKYQNYQQLFISLSKDYQALHIKYKSMEESLQRQNKTLSLQKRRQNQALRQEIQTLQHQNDFYKKQLVEARTQCKKVQQELLQENEMMKGQIASLNKSLRISKQSQANSGSQENTLKQQLKKALQQQQSFEKETLSKGKQLSQAYKRIQEVQAQLTIKAQQLKDLKLKKHTFDSIKQESQSLQKELNDLTKQHKSAKEQLKGLNKKYGELQQELASKDNIIKQSQQKRQTVQGSLREQITELNKEIRDIYQQIKHTKEEIRMKNKRIAEAQEQLFSKSEEIIILKRKISLLQNNSQFKLQMEISNEQIQALTKSNKSLKQEVKGLHKKVQEMEEVQISKDSQVSKLQQRLNSRLEQLQSVRQDHSSILRSNQQLKQQLKDAIKSEKLSQSIQRAASLQLSLSKKKDEIKQLQRQHQHQIQTISKHNKYLQQQNAQLRDKLQQIQQSLQKARVTISQKDKLIKQKEESIKQLIHKHKGIQTDLYQEISVLQDQKQQMNEQNQRIKAQKQQLQEAITQGKRETDRIQNLYQQKLSEAQADLQKLKQVHDLDETRVKELKHMIKNHQQINNQLLANISQLNMKTEEQNHQKEELFKIIQEIKASQGQKQKLYQDKVLEIEAGKQALNENVLQLQMELNYEKEYHAKCQFTIQEITQSRDEAHQLSQRHEHYKLKASIKELNGQVEKGKLWKKEIETLSVQLQRIQSNASAQKNHFEEIEQQKNEIIRQQRLQAERKLKQIQQLQQQCKRDKQSFKSQIKEFENKLANKNKEFLELKRHNERYTVEIESLKQTIDNYFRKIEFKDQQFSKETKEHEKTTQQLNNIRRQLVKIKSQCEQLENKCQFHESEKRIVQGKLSDKKAQIDLLQKNISNLQATCSALRKQTEFTRQQLAHSNQTLEETHKVNQQLQRANREFAQGEVQLSKKVLSLQQKIFQMQGELNSYTPRYEALLERNRELELRNKELSDMVNRAIEIQAQSYKNNILKEVKINTGEIIQQIKEEQQFHHKGRRKQASSSSNSKIQIQNIDASQIVQTPKLIQEPYTKLANQKMSAYKKKLSQSAQKLSGILSGKQQEGKIRSMRRQQDYELVSNQLQSLNNQKHEFIQKITSFAEKLKIL